MPLTEDRRKQLDDIVMRMEANNESEDDIRFVVQDFKEKYEGENEEPHGIQSLQKVTPSQALGTVAKAVGGYMLQGVPDVKELGKIALDVGKAGLHSVKQIFTPRNYANAIDHPIEFSKGAVKGVGQLATGIVTGSISGSAEGRKFLQGMEQLGIYNPQNSQEDLNPSNEYQKSGSDLVQSGGTLGMLGVGGYGLYKGIKGAINKPYGKTLIEGVDKGIKPSTQLRGKSFSKSDKVYKNTDTAVKSILENQKRINVVDKDGMPVQPQNYNIEDFANAIEQTKKEIYKQYHEMSTSAGNQGVGVDLSPVYKKVESFAQKPGEVLGKGDKRKGYSKGLRKHAYNRLKELEELQGEAPEIIEQRIAELNNSLDGYFKGTTTKDKASIDAAIAKELREALDNSIESAMGEGYQDLKNKYGALTAIEKDVNHRATIVARKANKNVFDLVDPFSLSNTAQGVLTLNPIQIAKGVAQFGIKEYYKHLNDPNRYIKALFAKASADYIPVTPAIEASTRVNLPKDYNIPAYYRKGVTPKTVTRSQGPFLPAPDQVSYPTVSPEAIRQWMVGRPRLPAPMINDPKIMSEVVRQEIINQNIKNQGIFENPVFGMSEKEIRASAKRISSDLGKRKLRR